MKILITGGAGFIGSKTVEQLAKAGHAVTALDSLSPQIHGEDEFRSPTFRAAKAVAEVIKGDVRDKQMMFDLVPQFEAILHLAAETGTGQSMYDVIRYNDVNVMGTAILLEALVANPGLVRRLVIASSRSVFGEGAYACAVHNTVYPGERDSVALEAGRFEPVCPICAAPVTAIATHEEDKVSPASVYAVTKLAQEQMMLSIGHARNIPTIALRYQNVYGPGQSLNNPYTGILSIFSREMLSARSIEIFEDGLESRDFVHVDDVARANFAALTTDLSGAHVINVGTGAATSVIDLVDALGKELNYCGDARISGRFRAGDIRHNFADVARAGQLLGWSPAIGVNEGLAGFADWVRGAVDEAGASSGYTTSLLELEQRGMIKGKASS